MRDEVVMLAQLVRWAEAEPHVRAMILTSTRATHAETLDALSDYDVVLYVDEPEVFAAGEDWIDSFGNVLVRFPVYPNKFEWNGLSYFTRMRIYQDGTKIDFTVAPLEELGGSARTGQLRDELDAGYRVLLDKDGLTTDLPQPTYAAYIPRPPTQQEFEAVVEEFWWETSYVAKNLWRDELLPAKYSFEVVMKLELLRRVLEWRVETDHDWSLRPGVLGKVLKKRLDPETWKELESTYVGTDLEGNWQALFATTALFRRMALEVAERLGLSYPHQLDQRMSAYLQGVRAMKPKPGR